MPLPAFPISIAQDSPWISHLSDLQCNIIKYHGRKYAWHIFFEIQHNKELQAQLWLTKLKIELKTALEQIQEGVKYRQALADGHPFDGGIIETISFSCTGIRRLNICSDITFESAFCEGMKKRQVQLLDDVSKFEDAFKQPLDGLLMIADNDKRSGKKRLRQRLLELAAFAHIHAVQKGKQEKRGKIAVEHFGYADGISQPLFLDTEIDAQHSTLHWNDKADAKELLLVTTQDNEQVAGSYLVFRKLEQNVMAFNEAVKRLTVGNNADKHLCPVLNAGGYYNPDLPAAMAVGRFKDGTPVVQHSEIVERQSNKEMDNDFNYEGDPGGLRCPRFGHVRLTNPRRDDDKQHRIARRGIPYNDTGLRRHFEKKDENLSLYTHNLGLLFMCYQKSIEKQFETVQGNWANLGSVKGLSQVGKDPIIGQQKPQGVMVDAENKLPKYLPKQWGQVMLHDAPINFDGFVTTKGGEYFFTPALHLLSNSP